MQLVESSRTPLAASQNGKVLSGLFAELGKFNQNDRRYPEDIYEQAYEELIPKIRGKRLLGELDHPIDYDEIRLTNVSHAITECTIEDGSGGRKVYGTVELLDTPAGLIAQSLVKAGIPLGISSRGVGATKQVRDGVEVTQLKLITYDLVAEPSFANAVLSPTKSKELTDSLNYIESKLPLNESVETTAIRATITRIRESLITKETRPKNKIDIKRVEIESLKGLLESAQQTIKSDTTVMVSHRTRIKRLEAKLKESQRACNSIMKNMARLQDAYNRLHETATTSEHVEELSENILQLQKYLAVEKRGMAYDQVSDLLEGATTEEEIENRLNSLSSMSKRRYPKVVPTSSLTESTNKSAKELKGLAAIVAKV